ncbi:MAG: hypothetical protein KDB27_00775 [Planctomycetales bacterium]|nr:hypothetical protein [Planctomycetales bacterium]
MDEFFIVRDAGLIYGVHKGSGNAEITVTLPPGVYKITGEEQRQGKNRTGQYLRADHASGKKYLVPKFYVTRRVIVPVLGIVPPKEL